MMMTCNSNNTLCDQAVLTLKDALVAGQRYNDAFDNAPKIPPDTASPYTSQQGHDGN